MTELRVWAPGATRGVDVVTDHAGTGTRRLSMNVDPGGWYSVDVPAGEVMYGFSIDGGRVLPDPRSPWQPDGIAGLSRTVDHAAFEWNDEAWRGRALDSAVIYELHIGTFTPEGTFDAAISRLAYLVELGITHVQTMPVAEFPGARGWGYDGVFLFAPSRSYGGPEGFKRLVDACHHHGLGVILDVVYNHLGPDGNVLGEFGPYFTDRYKTPWGAALNFDGPDSDEVRQFVIDNAVTWLRDYHVDGLRLDAVHAIVDASACHIVAEVAGAVRRLSGTLGRDLFVTAEADTNDPRLVRSPSLGGYGLHGVWLEDVHHAWHAWLTGERNGWYADFGTFGQIADALNHGYVYRGQRSTARRRRHGRPADNLPASRFIAFLQNHDQVGNRAQGERLGGLVSPSRLRAALAFVLLGPFVPLIFQGEEWSASTPFLYFTDHQNATLATAVSKGRRQEFSALAGAEVPDPQDPATYRRSKLCWSEIERADHAESLDWVRSLLRLRAKRHPPFGRGTEPRCGQLDVAADGEARHLVMGHDGLVVVGNFGTRDWSVQLGAAERVALSSESVDVRGRAVMLPPDSVAIVDGRGPDGQQNAFGNRAGMMLGDQARGSFALGPHGETGVD